MPTAAKTLVTAVILTVIVIAVVWAMVFFGDLAQSRTINLTNIPGQTSQP
jgi:hypothetical protein